MRKIKRIATVGLVATMVAASFAGCGKKSDDKKTDSKKETKEYEYSAVTSDDGKVLNIYVWNEEFADRFQNYYPGYVANDKDKVTAGGKIGDVEVKFTVVPNAENAYQNNLDDVLSANGKGQEKAAADDKIDIFLVEADYALKYVDTNFTLDVKDLGLDGAADFKDQYKYTQDVVTDGKGRLKGTSWQGCPGALIYRADIAEKAFGTSDPAEVQKKVADWDTFLASAKEVKDAGYYMTATANDTFRVFSNNVNSKWVEDGVLNIDANIKKWVDMSKDMWDNGYTSSTAALWSDPWSAGFWQETGKVFCYFGPAWMIDFSMSCDKDGSVGSEGNWRVTTGPQGFFWGGTWVCGANGTDNKTLVADIMKTMTADEDILSKIVEEKSDFVNNKNVISKYATDDKFGNKYLGNQNPIKIFADGVATVDLSNCSAYDQGCNEEFQNAMKDYFEGNTATYEDAVASFAEKVKAKYPDVEIPE